MVSIYHRAWVCKISIDNIKEILKIVLTYIKKYGIIGINQK